VKTPEIRHRSPTNVSDLFPQNPILSDDSDSRRRQLSRDLRHLRRKDLIERYSAEWNCFRGMKGRARTGAAVLARFTDFLSVLGPCPAPGWTVDRIDPFDPEYAPGKVRWASKVTQANNRTNTIMLAGSDGRVRPIAEWARLTRQKADTLRKRYERGWTDVEIINGERSIHGNGDADVQGPTRRTGKWQPIFTDERKWEAAWKAWTGQAGYKAMTRDEFMLWVLTNECRYRLGKLERRFPDQVGEGADPNYAPKPPLTDDPEYQWFVRVCSEQRTIQCRVSLAPNDLLSTLCHRAGGVRSAEAIHKLIADMREAKHHPHIPPF
jgi:hypothetical protein